MELAQVHLKPAITPRSPAMTVIMLTAPIALPTALPMFAQATAFRFATPLPAYLVQQQPAQVLIHTVFIPAHLQQLAV